MTVTRIRAASAPRAAGKVPETYLAGKAVSLSRLLTLAKKYSLPTRPYPPLSLKAGTSFSRMSLASIGRRGGENGSGTRSACHGT